MTIDEARAEVTELTNRSREIAARLSGIFAEYPDLNIAVISEKVKTVQGHYIALMKILGGSGLAPSAYGMDVFPEPKRLDSDGANWRDVLNSYSRIFSLCNKHGGCGNYGADGVRLVDQLLK